MYKPFIATVLLAIPLSAAAHAEVILNAGSEFGGASVTVDVTNGLEYLDLALTTNISYSDMIDTHLAAGGIYEGWRHATSEDIFALLSSAGIFNVTGSEIGPTNLVRGLSDSLGLTFSFPDGNLAQGVIDNGPDDPAVFGFGIAFDLDEFVEIGYYFFATHWGTHESDGSTGHYLVRSVPAPGSTAILAMTGLLATRRRR